PRHLGRARLVRTLRTIRGMAVRDRIAGEIRGRGRHRCRIAGQGCAGHIFTAAGCGRQQRPWATRLRLPVAGPRPQSLRVLRPAVRRGLPRRQRERSLTWPDTTTAAEPVVERRSWIPMIGLFLAQVLMSFSVAALPISLGGIGEDFGVPPTVAGSTIVVYGI